MWAIASMFTVNVKRMLLAASSSYVVKKCPFVGNFRLRSLHAETSLDRTFNMGRNLLLANHVR